MSTTIEFDLKDVLAKLDQKLDTLTKDFADLKTTVAQDVADLKTTVAKDVGDLKTEVRVLQERVNAGQAAIEKRLDSQAFWLRGVGVGIVLSLLGVGFKVFGIGIH